MFRPLSSAKIFTFIFSSSTVLLGNVKWFENACSINIIPYIIFEFPIIKTGTYAKLHFMGVFENRVLWRIFEPKGDEVTLGSRKLYYEELHILHSLLNDSRHISWVRHVACMGKKRNA
jgi:hypothetical protein